MVIEENVPSIFEWFPKAALEWAILVLVFFLLLGSKKDAYDRLVRKRKKMLKKEERLHKKIQRRNLRNARKFERAVSSKKYKTYDGNGDY